MTEAINISNGEHNHLLMLFHVPSHAAGLLPAEELSVVCWQCSCFLNMQKHKPIVSTAFGEDQ